MDIHRIPGSRRPTDPPKASKDSKSRRFKKTHKPRWWLRVSLILVLLMLLAGGAFAAKTYLSLNKVIQKHTGISAEGLKGDIELSKLKGEGDGRVNILLLGTGDSGHAGEQLTDTIIVASIDPKTNDVAMVGIPRDLYVKIPNSGWEKINTANYYGEQTKTGNGPDLAKQTVSQVLGVPIHYYVRIDFTGLRDAVNSLGGIDVYNENDLNDPEYPCDKNESRSCGFKLKAGQYHMDGATALKFARCRKGSCGDDYGRARRQQQVLVAMRQKALTLGNILNPTKASELIGIVGDHVRTDIQVEELKRMIDIGKKIKTDTITNKVLDTDTDALVKNSSIDGASVVIPTLGIGKYTAIQSFVKSVFVDGYIKQEAASIHVEAGTPRSGTAYALSVILKSLGYRVIKTSAADKVDYSQTVLYDNTGGKKPYTLKYLENRFGVSAQTPPEGTHADADITVIVGADYKPLNNN